MAIQSVNNLPKDSNQLKISLLDVQDHLYDIIRYANLISRGILSTIESPSRARNHDLDGASLALDKLQDDLDSLHNELKQITGEVSHV